MTGQRALKLYRRVERYDPDRTRLIALGYKSIAHVPVLFGTDGRYLSEVNRYLRERATMTWPPERDPAQLAVRGKRFSYLRILSLKKIADSLGNFIGWLESRKYDWRTIEYDPQLCEYGEDMESGEWSREKRAGEKGKPLASATTNSRMDFAADFLLWAGTRHLRAPFLIPLRSFSHRFATGASTHASTKRGQVRPDRRRQDPVNLRLPEISELRSWIAEVERRKGYTKALACRTILGTGIRRDEGAQLPIDFVPMNRKEWNVGKDNRVRFLLTEGTKGGRSRIVTIPLRLADEIHRYRIRNRVWAQAKWIKSHRGQPKPTRLFLGAHDGSPLSDTTIYDAWTSVTIFNGWSPHLGRHTWACYELLDALRLEAVTAGFAPGAVSVTWLESAAQTLISIVIQPNLGHLGEETTKIYLQWLRFQLAMPSAYSEWHEFLDAHESNE